MITVGLFLLTVFYFFYLSADDSAELIQEQMIIEANIRNSSQAFGLGVVCNIFTVLFFASPLSKMVRSLSKIASMWFIALVDWYLHIRMYITYYNT